MADEYMVGPPKVRLGCPPPDLIPTDEDKSETSGPDEICLETLARALADIERWLGSIRQVLEAAPPGWCISYPSGKLAPRRRTRKRPRKA